jgi:hypothetical protein
VVKVRLRPDLRQALEGLAKRNNRDLSREIRDALYYWLNRSGRPELHIGSLTSFIELLVTRIEQRSKRHFTDDAVTAVAVREQVDRLIRHFVPESNKSVTVPRDLDIVGDIIALAELIRSLSQQIPHKEWRRLPEAFVHGPSPALERIVTVEGSVLARIMEDLRGLDSNQPRRRHK